jgi:Coenzyme PQQ synthesis protein D (PqqD)
VSGAEIKLDPRAVEARTVDGELVIYDLRNRRYLGGNAAAAALWPQLVEGTSLDRLSSALVDAYRIAPERADADAARFVEWLSSEGLLAGRHAD